LKKYDPVLRKHVEFKEGKIKLGGLPTKERAPGPWPGALFVGAAARPARFPFSFAAASPKLSPEQHSTGETTMAAALNWHEQAKALDFRSQAFIGGKYVPAASGETFENISPIDGKPARPCRGLRQGRCRPGR